MSSPRHRISDGRQLPVQGANDLEVKTKDPGCLVSWSKGGINGGKELLERFLNAVDYPKTVDWEVGKSSARSFSVRLYR